MRLYALRLVTLSANRWRLTAFFRRFYTTRRESLLEECTLNAINITTETSSTVLHSSRQDQPRQLRRSSEQATSTTEISGFESRQVQQILLFTKAPKLQHFKLQKHSAFSQECICAFHMSLTINDNFHNAIMKRIFVLYQAKLQLLEHSERIVAKHV